MQIRSGELDTHLGRTLAPLYVIHGDEPLLSLEAADAVRARARSTGHTERTVLLAERGLDWSALAAAGASLSLFGDRRIIELRVPSGKPGTDGANAIAAYAKSLPADTVTIVSLPRLDRAGQNSAWFSALAEAGVVVNVFPVERAQLPAWIAGRLARRQQRADAETLAFLADCVEGNLLAAHQEIQKLGLLYPPGEIGFAEVRAAVLDVARYDVYGLSEAMLAGDRTRLSRMLAGLEAEGEAPPRVLWVVAEDIRALARLQSGIASGMSAQDVFRQHRIWGEPRQRLLARASKRLGDNVAREALAHAARVDRIAKGLVRGNVWDELLQLALRFSG